VFSGGSYEEVARWLWNFATSHGKREDPRVEVTLDDRREREGHSYGLRLRLEGRESSLVELSYPEVAQNRGSLAWCAAQAARIRQLARGLVGTTVSR
jgi:hypothetical protein